MAQITARVSAEVAEALDAAAATLKRSSAEVIRQAWKATRRTLATSPWPWSGCGTPPTRYSIGRRSGVNYSILISPNPPKKVSVAAGCRGEKVRLRIWDNGFCKDER